VLLSAPSRWLKYMSRDRKQVVETPTNVAQTFLSPYDLPRFASHNCHCSQGDAQARRSNRRGQLRTPDRIVRSADSKLAPPPSVPDERNLLRVLEIMNDANW